MADFKETTEIDEFGDPTKFNAANTNSAAPSAIQSITSSFSDKARDLGNTISGALQGFNSGGGFKGMLGRLSSAGLAGSMPTKNLNPSVTTTTGTGYGSPDTSWKVKISLAGQTSETQSSDLLTQRMLKPLAKTGGVIFPYTPTVSMSYKANYVQQKLTHANYASYSYENSEVSEIQIEGEFSVQNKYEGRYLLAVLYFFRTVTKMYYASYGDSSAAIVGNPPPLVYLDGYSTHYFPHVTCVVTSFSHSLPNDVDYLKFEDEQSSQSSKPTYVYLPTLSKISVTLQPIVSRNNVYNNFDLKEFANGRLLDKGRFL